ncbi:MAG: PspC domain-containing protein [Candidatus Mcinerneyibacterium aminivorans]|jgi:phage shock protein C|uniref:PspC domain-containing protein n=1 Tax=Candidatus Mcinerneyibacterium aminivorans TaxID=2703815 RepID=A0A5D0MEQ5_9BACT|nr:MAG: PspC domain-containing protein [Candidatus Mcinerneyibacterium aminivorans]
MEEIKKLYRSKKDRVFAGICGGLGKYFKVDPVFIRIIFAVGAIWNLFTVFVYILMWLFVPEETDDNQKKSHKIDD